MSRPPRGVADVVRCARQSFLERSRNWINWQHQKVLPFGGVEHALSYLGAYTHCVAISNHRLVALTEGNVTFRWRDSAHGNKQRLMTLPVDEFLRAAALGSVQANR
jgi:hypothetical protein